MRLVTGLRVGFTCAIELLMKWLIGYRLICFFFVFLFFKGVYRLDMCNIL